jgi:hypothetical protein
MPYTPVRRLPDADELLKDILRGATLTAFVENPANLWALVESGPVAIAYRFGGKANATPLVDVATIQVITYGTSRKVAADCAETVRCALQDAAKNRAGNAHGYIERFAEVIAPAETRDPGLPDRKWRFDATYSITVRPNPA